MTDLTLPFVILHDMSSSASGKFYAAVLDDQFPMTIHGPKTKNASGTFNQLGSRSEVLTKVQTKKKKYATATLFDLPNNVCDVLTDRICRHFNVPESAVRLSDDEILITNVGSFPGSSQSRKPRRRKSAVEFNVWL